MLISDQYRFLYIHIPKTGGSTLTWRLRNIINNPCGQDTGQVAIQKGWQGKFHVNGQHSSYRQNFWRILGRNDYFLFAFVRNPWALMFSWYTAISRNSAVEPTREGFADFVRHVPGKYRKRVDRTQSSYLQGILGVGGVRNIFKFEDFEQEFERLLGILGIPREEVLFEDQNISNKNALDYCEFYDNDTQRIVGERYRSDVLNFGYGFPDRA